jgi:hypothetical protein
MMARARRDPALIDDSCDRCHARGTVRLERPCTVLDEQRHPTVPFTTQPAGVTYKALDLVLCAVHFNTHERALTVGGWHKTEDTR